MLNWLKRNATRAIIPAFVSLFVATFIAWAAQTNYLGAVFIADSTVPSRQLTINSDGSAAVQSPSGGVGAYSAVVSGTITRPSNTTTYTANTAWANATSGATYTVFAPVCRAATGQVLIPSIDIYSSVNATTKLQGIFWLFTDTVGTPVNDNATFNIAAADFAKLTGNVQGFPFTMTSNQASGAANAGISLTGTTYHAACGSGSTAMYGMVQVVNAYVPTSAEILTVKLHVVGLN